MLFSSNLNPLPVGVANLAPQEPKEPQEPTEPTDEVGEVQPSNQTEPSLQPETRDPAQAVSDVNVQPADTPSEATSQSVVQASSAINVAPVAKEPVKEASDATGEANARAAAEAYRAEVLQTEILERTSNAVIAPQLDLKVLETDKVASNPDPLASEQQTTPRASVDIAV